MGERTLSNKEIESMESDAYKDVRKLRGIFRRAGMRAVEKRAGDRRVAINSYVDPKMDRRSGYDRRTA